MIHSLYEPVFRDDASADPTNPAGLPTPRAGLVGSLGVLSKAGVETNVYVCEKKADNTFAWARVSPVAAPVIPPVAPGFFMGLTFPSLPYAAGDPQVLQATAAFSTASLSMQGNTKIRLRSFQLVQAALGVAAGELCKSLVVPPVILLFDQTDGVYVPATGSAQLIAGHSYQWHFYFSDPTEAHVAHGLTAHFEADLFA